MWITRSPGFCLVLAAFGALLVFLAIFDKATALRVLTNSRFAGQHASQGFWLFSGSFEAIFRTVSLRGMRMVLLDPQPVFDGQTLTSLAPINAGELLFDLGICRLFGLEFFKFR
jgi:hypothetical protein